MTRTNRPVQRVTVASYAVLYPQRRPIVVRIAQGDLLEFREKGRKQRFCLPIDTAFGIAVKASAGFRLCMLPGSRLKKGAAA